MDLKLKSDSILRFPLANLSYFKSEALNSNSDGADQFIITIALIYNDIKGLLLFWEIIEEFEKSHKTENKICGKTGQFVGLKTQVYKYILSSINEISVLFVEQKDLIQSDKFEVILKSIPQDAKAAWTKLCKFCFNDDQADEDLKKVRLAIVKIRSNGSFHYNQVKALFNAYKETFQDKKEQPLGRAYLSIGNGIEDSRFYFADAAMSKYVSETLKACGPNQEKIIKEFLRSSHHAIAFVVREYLKSNGGIVQLNEIFDKDVL